MSRGFLIFGPVALNPFLKQECDYERKVRKPFG